MLLIRWLALTAAVLVVAAAAFQPRDIRAHATCNTQSCCSPHGQYGSDTGCDFWNCAYWNDVWTRSIYCAPGSQAYNGQLCGEYDALGGHAYAWADHTVESGPVCCWNDWWRYPYCWDDL